MPICTECRTFYIGRTTIDATQPSLCPPCDAFAADPRPDREKLLERRYRGKVFPTFAEAGQCAIAIETKFASSVLVATLLGGCESPIGGPASDVFVVVPHADKSRADADLLSLGFTRVILTYPHGDDRKLVPTVRHGKSVRESKEIQRQWDTARKSGLAADIDDARAEQRNTGPKHRHVR